MKIRVVGGGWYGCHLAAALIAEGHEVTLFERADRLFAGASGGNQGRLHLGFHYPRDAATREDARDSFGVFMAAYGHLTRAVPINIYAVAKDRSLIDWRTYAATMRASGLGFLEVDGADYGLGNVEGAMLTGERVVLADAARDYFTERLAGRVELGVEVERFDDGDWDRTIDCTYGGLAGPPVEWVEPCILLLFAGAGDVAVTVMDGPEGCSVYPYAPGTVSLTSVCETPFARCPTMAEARATMSAVDHELIGEVQRRTVARIRRYLPGFEETYGYSGYAVAARVKPVSSSDRRATVVSGEGRVISVFPGKISGVFEAERAVRERLGPGAGVMPFKAAE